MDNILEVSNLNKSYKNFSLSNVSFTLPKDCITGFIGANGAGKTTTIRTILGLAQKDSGDISIFGKNVAEHEREIKDRIGVVLDEGCFYDSMTIKETKSIIAPAYSAWDNKTFDNYLDRFSLDPTQKISTLSKGMRMKFSLALALSHNAELLIMDEPTSGLDPLVRSQLLEIMREYMKDGDRSIFFSTHITSDLDKVADMLILINDGEIIFEKEKDALIENHYIVKGDKKALNDDNKKLFIEIEKTAFGFAGLTNKLDEVKKVIPDIIVEKVTVEDIMLGYLDKEEYEC